MNESIQQLTDKIYKEGVEKAEEKAREIIQEATQKSIALVTAAEEKAKRIIDSAEEKAQEVKLKNEAEMKLSANHALMNLKQKISDVIIMKITSESTLSAVRDTAFIQSLISTLMDYWLHHFGQEERLQILLPENEYQQYRKFLEERTAALLKSGISTEFSDSIGHGFQINAIDQGFRVSFTDDDFERYFRTFARPRIYKLLFGKES
jgi:V/A-type H+-transporting ATPase subunit E